MCTLYLVDLTQAESDCPCYNTNLISGLQFCFVVNLMQSLKTNSACNNLVSTIANTSKVQHFNNSTLRIANCKLKCSTLRSMCRRNYIKCWKAKPKKHFQWPGNPVSVSSATAFSIAFSLGLHQKTNWTEIMSFAFASHKMYEGVEFLKREIYLISCNELSVSQQPCASVWFRAQFAISILCSWNRVD